MLYRIKKFAVGGANLAAIIFTLAMMTPMISWSWGAGCALLSALWLALTTIGLRQVFVSYFNWFSRLRFQFGFTVGTALAMVALFTGYAWSAAMLLVAWMVVLFFYRRNRRKFIETKHGPIPANAWLNPPTAVISPGDFEIYSGSFGPNRENPAGHAELCYLEEDGSKWLFSCWIPKGVVMHEHDGLVARWLKHGDHFTALRLRKPLTPEEIVRAREIAHHMKVENLAFVERETARRSKQINRLPLPASWRAALLAKFTPTGYDFSGLIIGTRDVDNWTCIGACLELFSRLGRKMLPYGTGLLGLGTGMLDPLNPARLYDDPNFELLTLDHKFYWETYGVLPPVGWSASDMFHPKEKHNG